MSDSTVPKKRKSYFFYLCLLAFVIAIALRLVSLNTSPLFDTTETRYASIAQKIILDDDWVTLRLPHLHEPFLGKPPLSFWLLALSYQTFGTNEFSARFPNFLVSLLVLLFTYLIARKFYDKRTALIAPLVLFSGIFFFIQAGTVSLDMLVCCTSTASIWAYLSVLQAKQKKQKWWQLFYELFLGVFLGLGMLNKGPLSIVILLGTIGLYFLWERKLKILFVPNWLLVFTVATLVCLPWYLAVQKANPEFFSYFFLQEHLYRYLHKDYGDRYGNGHVAPHGMSWIYTLAAFMPWSFFILPLGFSVWQKIQTNQGKVWPQSLKLLLCWAAFSPLFFTMARSILMTYIIASLPPLAILCARTLSQTIYKFKKGEYKELKNILFNFLFNPFNSLVYIVISLIVIGAATISYSGGKPYSLSRGLIMASTITVTLLAVLLGYAASHRTQQIFKAFIITSVLGIPLSMAFWYGPLSESIGAIKSMKAVISDLKHKVPDYRKHKIYFLGDSQPYSWYFYIQLDDVTNHLKLDPEQHEVFHHHIAHECPLEEEYDKNNKRLLVVTEANLYLVRQKYPYAYARGLIAKDGKYYIFGEGHA
jgi:4-amino-4-deoxy-L-arabinose transferase-like glycosyltransferase